MDNPFALTRDSPGKKEEMAVSSYDYELPQSAIRLVPPENRDGSKMMVVPRSFRSREELSLDNVLSLHHYLQPGDLLVLNDTRVIPARVYGKTSSGRAIEVLFSVIRIVFGFKCLVFVEEPWKVGDGNPFSRGNHSFRNQACGGERLLCGFPSGRT